ncbi:MAG: CoA pyrophosphatase [Phenylobacterium sp.]|uniref:NUDIX hydrolase n=1 Tax=Phenylobacterium sp. TaxID=1871053 RepID=UPI002600C19D|nr:CoA pyrophosphatase [Phenylobacterium sp.]MCA3709483.1 CoA pyrophosphatase [Phenylobacterium sp.]MCA3713533.1 CoA pyrophosphatase [Phenylobacterium sp.]MCA3713870.1 CoA pyrophosphatase [Phenylobacterium sp.]MCA3723499.1 CoA pyrophosphatase [Phenylobacterium sp.]MCA3726017.1 CoA pyrophosphatase [Phenylobacterium sp.]
MSHAFTPDFRDRIAEACASFPRIAHSGGELKRAAVALTLTASDDGSGQTAFLLTRRAESLRAHSGQWALPGGRLDPGETLAQAALRELSEEVGLDLPQSDILGLLDDYPTRSGYVITPVVTWLEDASALRPNPAEVASTHLIRLDYIAAPDAVDFETIPESDRPLIRLRISEEHRIHAPTAAVVYQLRELVAGRVTRVTELEQPVFAWR